MRWSLPSIHAIQAISLLTLLISVSASPEDIDQISRWCERRNLTSGSHGVDDDVCSRLYVVCHEDGGTKLEQCPDGFVFSGSSKLCTKPGWECPRPVEERKATIEPSQCREDEEFLECGPKCQPTCPIVDRSAEDSSDCEGCKPGCFCKNGLLRDFDDSCVLKDQCTQNRLPRNGDIFECRQADGDYASTVLLCDRTYYRCNNWKKTKLFCDDGQLFDADTRTCRPLEELPHCQFDCSDKETKSMNAIGCSRFYWWCWDGIPSKKNCDVGRYFNPKNNQCDFRHNVEACKGRDDYIELPSKPVVPRTTTKPTPAALETLKMAGITDTPTHPPLDCTTLKDGNYADPTDPCADYFYKCSGSMAFKTQCPGGLVYDMGTDACQRREDVPSCVKAPAYSGRRLSDNPLEQGVLVRSSYSYQHVEHKYPLNCTDMPDGHYPDPHASCAGHFYMCSNQIATYMTCPPSLYYHKEARECRRWNDVPGCGSDLVPPTTTTSTTSTNALMGQRPTPVGLGPNLDCSSAADGNYADPSNPCSNTYFTCTNQMRLIRPCPADLYYDVGSDQCLRRDDVPACGGARPNKTSDTAPAMCPKPNGVFAHPHYRCNNAYIVCKDGQWELHQCQTTDHIFDPAIGACADARKVQGCDVEFCKGKDNLARYPADNNCTSNFITCVHGIAVYQPCPSPLVFSSQTGNCEYAADVPACKIITRRIEGQGELVHQERKQVITDTIQGSQQSIGACQSIPDGDYPSESCSKYYRSCGAGIEYRRECQPGLVFDGSMKRCENPQLVQGCGGQPRPTPAVESGHGASQTIVQEVTITKNVTKTNSSFASNFCLNMANGYYPTAACAAEAIKCENGKAILTRCSPGTVFDGQSGRCRPKVSVPACNNDQSDHHRPQATNQNQPSTDWSALTQAWMSRNSGSVDQYSSRPGYGFGQDDHKSNFGQGQGNQEGHGSHFPPGQLPSVLVAYPTLKPEPHPEPYNHYGPYLYGSRQPQVDQTNMDQPDPVCRGRQDGWKMEVAMCSAFYMECHLGKLRRMQCPDGHIFDRSIRHCQSIALVGECRVHSTTPAQQTGEVGIKVGWCSNKPDGSYPKGDCTNQYIKCEGGETLLGKCHQPRFVFNPQRRRCEHVASVSSCFGKMGSHGVSNQSMSRRIPYPPIRHVPTEQIDLGEDHRSNERYSTPSEFGHQSEDVNCPYPNEIYTTCGAACEPTCTNLRPECNDGCVAGCHCKPGYVRYRDNSCILAASCSGYSEPFVHGHEWNQCPNPYEIYKECANCEGTCGNFHPFCNEPCTSGCACRDGYVRSGHGRCVPSGLCSFYSNRPHGSSIESWKSEYSNRRDGSSIEGGRSEGHNCNDGHGHKCRSGSSEEKCPLPNERFSKCKAGCQPTCFNPNKKCDRKCTPGCICLDGYVRSHTGNCVLASMCFQVPKPMDKEKSEEEKSDRSDRSDKSEKTESSEELTSSEEKYKDFCNNKKHGTYKLGDCSSKYIYCKYDVAHVLECSGCEIFNGDRCVACWSKRKCKSHCRKKQECRRGIWDRSGGRSGSREFRYPRWDLQSASHEYFSRFDRLEGMQYCSHRLDGYYGVAPCHENYLHCHHGHVHWRHCEPGLIFDEELIKCIPANQHYGCGFQAHRSPYGIEDSYFMEESAYPHPERPIQPYPHPERPIQPYPHPERPIQPYPHPERPIQPYPYQQWPIQHIKNVSSNFGSLSAIYGRYGSIYPKAHGQQSVNNQYQGGSFPWYRPSFYPVGQRPGGYSSIFGQSGQQNATAVQTSLGGSSGQYLGGYGYASNRFAYGAAPHRQYPVNPLSPYRPHSTGYNTGSSDQYWQHNPFIGGYRSQPNYRPGYPYAFPQPFGSATHGLNVVDGPLPLPIPEPSAIDNGDQHIRVVDDVQGICRGLVDGSLVSLGKCKREYAECKAGLAVPRLCADLRHIFDDVTRRCIDRDDEPICRILPPHPTPARAPGGLADFCSSRPDGYYSHPSNCTKFIQCHKKSTFLFQCSYGLVFNGKEGVKACDYPRHVPECVDPHLGINNDSECEGKADGAFLRHPSICQKYRRCVHGRLVDHDCPDGLVFNMRLSVCDFVHSVPECNR